MLNTSYKQILELVRQLKPEEKTALVEELRAEQSGRVTREMLLAEFERRKAAGADRHDSLFFGKYAYPPIELSSEELAATLKEVATEWEKELDDLADTP
jgi:hypothetical protein